jgi:hypothetical protein
MEYCKAVSQRLLERLCKTTKTSGTVDKFRAKTRTPDLQNTKQKFEFCPIRGYLSIFCYVLD